MTLLICCVCGRASTRPVWNNNNVYGTTKVACDFHSQNAIQSAVSTGNPAQPGQFNIPKTHHEREDS